MISERLDLFLSRSQTMTEHPAPTPKDLDTFDNQDTGLPCPCCSKSCWRDSVDVGVGIVHGPWGCACGWSEREEYDCRNGMRHTDQGDLIDQLGRRYPKGYRGKIPKPFNRASAS
ncbi:MAG: hypothetical protein AAF950_18300 [Pseudomonadota bacterium]